MKRDMFKVVETMEEIPSAYDITYGEILSLRNKCMNGGADAMYNAFLTAFKYGFALTQRMERNKRKRGTAA